MRKICKVKTLSDYDLELEFDDGYPELWTSLKRSAKVCLLYGVIRWFSSRFVSVHPVNWSGANKLICVRTRSISR